MEIIRNPYSKEFTTENIFVPNFLPPPHAYTYGCLLHFADKNGELIYKSMAELIQMFNCLASDNESLELYIKELEENKHIMIEENKENQNFTLTIITIEEI